MKKAIFLAAITIFAACNKPETTVPTADHNTLYAQIEQEADTKTYMDESNNIRWSSGDQIVGFMKSPLGLQFEISSSSVGKTSAHFDQVGGNDDGLNAGTEWDHNIVYYPYSAAVEAEKSGSNYSLSIVLPAEQTYAEESFGEGSMAMVAVSEDNNITFRNVLGGMKLQLKGTQTVTSITLEGKNNEKLSGVATVTAYTDETKPAITMASDASTSVALNCGSGVQLNESIATEFIIALPPVLFSRGFTVTVIDSDSQTYTVETDKSNEVIRSSLLVMPPVTLGASDEDEPEISGVDYIDEYGVNHGKGIRIGETVWAPVNCGYHETDYAYGKLYQWGRKYGQGYSGNLYDESGNLIGTYSDATTPTIEEGGVSVIAGNDKSNENIFYTGTSSYYYDWADPQDGRLWNFGTEDIPVKTEYDPCPEGWRVPTYAELNELCKNRSAWTSEDDKPGYWFSGASFYTDEIPQVFFPAAGFRYDFGDAHGRGYNGSYWSSRPNDNDAYRLGFYSGNAYMRSRSRAYGYSIRCVQDDKELIPVSSLTLDETLLLLNKGETATLSATISPSDANHQSAYWYSENPSIATVDQNGMVTAVVAGTTNIIAVAGMQTAACEVIVKSSASYMADYVDEYGVNHGKGIRIGETVWAPVNCGYHETDYAYGKLYQWGRKYGQGYSGDLCDESGNLIGTYSDATTPTIEEGGVSVVTGNHKSKENIFYTGTSDYNYDWVYPQEDELWNSGTEDNPVKTEYDPCPAGWRVPTYAELNELLQNRSSLTSKDGQNGYWFSGASSYTDDVPQVFFPAAGYRFRDGYAYRLGYNGRYWSSRPRNDHAYRLSFSRSRANMDDTSRACGYSVRCVQDDNELIPVSSLTLDETSLLLNEGETATLSATISPSDANHQSAYWYSENPSIATVDQNGMVRAVVAGTTNIIAVAGMQTAACEVIVKPSASDMADYVDEYGVNHGKGVNIGAIVWAPVNCGYHETDYAYGKLYQWGRKYGQGYDGRLYDGSHNSIGTYSDATTPTIEEGGVSVIAGNDKSNENIFYTSTSSYDDWADPQDDKLWNSGTESKPVKTEYDPCPEGWRVPTYAELSELYKNRSAWTSEDDQPGYWFSGASSYTDEVPQIFFPAAGGRDYDGYAYNRGDGGYYWSSRPNNNNAYNLYFGNGSAHMGNRSRAYGSSVRCVQVTDEVAEF